ncbi:DNA polymerase III subunit gamma/tau [Moraxella sp. ZJ142]|uniref:DNA polymerase III subunit gamma/tau n=1 Tax=Moraxella marmotae TaxID=3344520 RepID=UPI0035D4C8E4
MDKQYQVLARKYRPKNFHELLGQTHVWHALANAVDTGRLHHAYLFTGTRGVGKTTIARILAKCLNCETGVTSQPCGVCDTCVSIDSGRFLDLIEIDAASRTKVEDTRELLENVPYAPVQGRYKVYLIDEVHMLSTHSFNALLKTLEEPPEHVKFLFATTDPQKLPITIISRCLQFVLRPLSQALLAEHLAKVLGSEQVVFANEAVWQIASAAKGSVRDALSLTDQAIAFGGGQIQADTVNEMLGLVNSINVFELIEAVYQDNRTAVASHIATMRAKMVDATAVFDELIDSIHQMAMMQVLPDVPMDMNQEQVQHLQRLAAAISADALQLYYEILTKSRDNIRFASTPMQALEMGILRLLAFRPLTGEQCCADIGIDTNHDNTNANAEPPKPDAQNLSDEHNNQSNTVSDTDTIDADAKDTDNATTTADNAAAKDDALVSIDKINHSASDNGNGNENTLYLQSADDKVMANNSEPVDHTIATADTDIDDLMAKNADNSDNAADNLPNLLTVPTDSITADVTDTPILPLESSDGSDDKHNQTSDDCYAIDTTSPLMTDDLTDNAAFNQQKNTVEPIDALAADVVDMADADNANHAINNNRDSNIDDNTKNSNDNAIADNHASDNAENADKSTTLTTAMTKETMLERLNPPMSEIVGEWDNAKWDYWLHLARQSEIFSADELALMANAVMVGDTAGESWLQVGERNSQVEVSFNSLHQKIAQHYPQIRLHTEPVLAQVALSPAELARQRQAQIRLDAQNQLINSPVFQKLWQAGYVISDGTPVLGNSKLSID